jgi:hypothetical protein
MSEQFELLENVIKVKNTKKTESSKYRITEVKMDSLDINQIKESVSELINALKDNGVDWKSNDNLLVFNLVKKVVSFVRKFKKIDYDNKKNLALKVLDKLFESEIQKLNLNDEVKTLIMTGVDIVVEPALDLALMTLEKQLKLKEKCSVFCK